MRTNETAVERRIVIEAGRRTVWQVMVERGLNSMHLLRDEHGHPLKEGNKLAWHPLNATGDDSTAVIKGHITVIAPPRRLALMAFMPACGLPDVPENYTEVEISLTEEDGRTLVVVDLGDFARLPHGARIAKQTGDLWVEALIRWKWMVEQEQEAAA